MKKKNGIIIGVIIAVVVIILGLVFLGPDKDTGAENPSENITQNEEMNEIVNWEGDTFEAVKEAIDLNSVDLSEYGISDDHEISTPYPVSDGFVYVVRDFIDEWSSKTYVFYTTADKVIYGETESDIPRFEGSIDEVIYITSADLDGVSGEEIVLNMPNGGNAGYESYILKINEDEVIVMQSFFGMEDANGFSFRFEAPFKMVVTNEIDDDEYIIDMKGNEEHERFFDAEGNPEMDGPEPMMDGYFIFEPVQIDDGYGVRRVQHTSIASHANCAGFAETVVKYVDGKFEVVDARFLSADDYVEYNDGYVQYLGFTRCDINEDGVDELITHTGTCEMDRIYNVYTVADDKLVYAGSIGGWHSSLYDGKGTITMAAGMSMEGSYYTYSLKDYKLVIDTEGDYTWDEDSSTLPDVGEKIEFTSYKYEKYIEE